VRRGLIEKIEELAAIGDPRTVYKPLLGSLQGCFRIPYSRYRAIFKVVEEKKEAETVFVLTILVVAVGLRKEGDKRDVDRLAEKLAERGLLASPAQDKDASEPT
jgi:mRNA-degrading endonuclease RelE of RelBE toxin-antitoxin system